MLLITAIFETGMSGSISLFGFMPLRTKACRNLQKLFSVSRHALQDHSTKNKNEKIGLERALVANGS